MENGSVEEEYVDGAPETEEFRFHTVGEQLKAERERQDLKLNEIATRTRVPMRHLEAIEKSEYTSLPGITYSLGFTRSYARALGLDATKLSNELRTELSASGQDGYYAPTQNYEPADSSRVPSKMLAWTAAAIGIIVLAGYLFWRSQMLDGGLETTASTPTMIANSATKRPDTATALPSATTMDGQVILIATDLVWVKIYDADEKRLYENEMKAGDQYRIPLDAKNPMIVTGRPQALRVTIDGKPVAALGAADQTIVDVGVSAASLTARPASSSSSDQTAAQ